ncbi:MAG: hypothetical protein Q7R40_14460 [Phaeospirillum sp.]|nr:hypothetical protein [Phaeospirillum sp.]
MTRDVPTASSPILRNPFHLLGVSSRDGRHRIVEAADEKALELDSEVCSKARGDLTNPRNRLAAELAWFPGLSPRKTQQLVQATEQNPASVFTAEGLPPLARVNLMISAVPALLESSAGDDWFDRIIDLSAAFEEIVPENVLADVNEDRKVAGFAEVKSVDAIVEGLSERRRELKEALRSIMDSQPPIELAGLVADLAESATNDGTEHPPKLIDDMIDAYEIGTRAFIEKEAENVRLIIERIKATAPSGEAAVTPLVERLEKVVKNWYAVARPIQIVSEAKGTTHDLSHAIAWETRGLAAYLNREHELLDSSRRLMRLIQDAFGNVAEVKEQVDDDVKVLADIARKKAVEEKTKPVYELCKAALDEVEGAPASGDSEGRKVLDAAKPLIAGLAGQGVDDASIREVEDFLAMTAMRCAVAFGNATDKWTPTVALLEEAERLVHDPEFAGRIRTNLDTCRKNHRLYDELEPVTSAPSLRTINGFGFTVYFKSDFDQDSGSYMVTYYFVTLMFPLFPICRYRVVTAGNGYRFLGKAPLRTFDKWHLAISILTILYMFVQGR